MNAFTITLAVVVSYFCGTLPSAIAVARSKGVDITSFGSGNPGASNVGRALGTKYFVIVMVMDALKGAVPVAVMLGDRHIAYLCGAAAVKAAHGRIPPDPPRLFSRAMSFDNRRRTRRWAQSRALPTGTAP